MQKNTRYLHLLGISHHLTPIEIREKIVFSEVELFHVLRKIKSLESILETFMVSTCNRTEIYIVNNSSNDIREIIIKALLEEKPNFDKSHQKYFYQLKGEEAIIHLFKVISGLDSMILGEPQIFGQMKSAYEIAQKSGTVGVYLDRLMNMAIQAGKRVRSETKIGKGAVSVGFATVELAKKVFKDLRFQKVLLIGAGEMGELIAKNFKKKEVNKLYIVNHTFQRSVNLSRKLNAVPIEWDHFHSILDKVDLIVSSIAYKGYMITKNLLEAKISERRSPMILIDISVPRNIASDVNGLENIFLYDIDSLQKVVIESIEKRKKEIPDAMNIIQEVTQKFMEWSIYLQVRPTILELKKSIYQHIKTEMSRVQNKYDQEQLKTLEESLERMAKKMLKLPTVKLKEYANGYPESDLRIDVVREIFGLK